MNLFKCKTREQIYYELKARRKKEMRALKLKKKEDLNTT